MTDVHTTLQRRRNMQAIRGRDTRPEIIVRKIVHRLGFRFRLHRRDLPGKPDIVLPRLKCVILVHGCFWHQHRRCKYAARPGTRPEFWAAKLDGNHERDKRVRRKLVAMGWKVLTIWECELRKSDRLTDKIARFLNSVT